MYFESKVVFDELSCSYCKHRFTDVVKLIPQCGNSICGECHEALVSDMSETREFKCKLCDHQPHTMPAEGLPNNSVVMRIIMMKPVNKALNEKTKKLKSTIEDIQQRIDVLKCYDRVQEIVVVVVVVL